MMRCTDCGMLHVSFQTNRKFSYTRSYFLTSIAPNTEKRILTILTLSAISGVNGWP